VLGEVRATGGLKESLAQLTAFDPRRELLLERDVLPPGDRQAGEPQSSGRQPFAPARIVERTPNRVVVEATLEKSGYLYLGDAWLPGWTAAARGQELPVLRANAAFRAVALPPGSHRVEFSYQPAGLVIGRWISLVTLACLLALCVSRWSSRRSLFS
jgi:hypothetical protein